MYTVKIETNIKYAFVPDGGREETYERKFVERVTDFKSENDYECYWHAFDAVSDYIISHETREEYSNVHLRSMKVKPEKGVIKFTAKLVDDYGADGGIEIIRIKGTAKVIEI